MNARVGFFLGFFYGEHGACRSYLLEKLFLLMLALDTFLLMIGHAGRYGMGGFNVAHFAWLEAIQPAPSAASYVGVLLLTGLLALVVALTGTRPLLSVPLFLLYTFSWSMSMLDSYQHHYFVSLVLFCLIFFPRTSARAIDPLPDKPKQKPKKKRAHERERDERARLELRGFAYCLSLLIAGAVYAAVDVEEHTWLAFGAFAGVVALATFVYRPARREPLLVSGMGFALLGATVAILYTYTAIAKMDPSWTEGHTLLSISSLDKVFAGAGEYAERFGVPRAKLWSLMATLVIPQELAIGACYLLAVRQDTSPRRWVRVACTLGFALAVVLHVGAEAMGLQIGWFSYYMLAFACCFLLPLPVVDRLATVVTAPARWLEQAFAEWEADDKSSAALGVGLAFGGAFLLVMVGQLIDLPGAVSACALAGGALIFATLHSLRSGHVHRTRRYAVATVVAGFAMWFAIAQSPVRFDFYRYLGGDLSRRGELQSALEAYVHGERYAPEGMSRAKQIRELRAQLQEQ